MLIILASTIMLIKMYQNSYCSLNFARDPLGLIQCPTMYCT